MQLQGLLPWLVGKKCHSAPVHSHFHDDTGLQNSCIGGTVIGCSNSMGLTDLHEI